MKQCIAVSFLLLAGTSFGEAIKETMQIKKDGVRFKVHWWDDGRDVPYKIYFNESGVKAHHKFTSDGRLFSLRIGSTTYSFTWDSSSVGEGSPSIEVADSGNRMLVDQDEEQGVENADADVIFDHRRLYACDDCENTFETLCGQGLDDVCYWIPILPDWFSDDHAFAMETLCTKFGEACTESPEAACENYCEDGPTNPPVPAPTPEPEPTPPPVQAPTPEPEPTPQPVLAPTPEPEPTPPPVPAPTPEPEPTPPPVPAPTPEPEPTPPPVPAPTPEPEPTPPPVPAPTPEPDVCSPNPCQNGGSCAEDIGGGHVCTCASGYGGMACQTDTSSLSAFYIEINFLGTWTPARQLVFQSAATRWSEVITHIPCGGSPAGRLLISATLGEIDGSGGTLGSAGPTSVWTACPSISLAGDMTFDISDIESLEADGTFEGVIMHEMGHVIGIGTLWGPGYGECATCSSTGSAVWTCPATLEAYADLGGTDSNIIERDGGSGTSCGHFDEIIFTDELMTGFVNSEMYLSKITAASLDDIDYIVDPSQADPYILPAERSGSGDDAPLFKLNDVAVDTTIAVVDEDGNVEERVGVMIFF